jgi:hypothetical protein
MHSRQVRQRGGGGAFSARKLAINFRKVDNTILEQILSVILARKPMNTGASSYQI